MRSLKVVGIFVAILAAAGVYMTQVGPDDAASNLSKWLAKFISVPDWLKPPAVDNLGSIIFGLILLMGLVPVISPLLAKERGEKTKNPSFTGKLTPKATVVFSPDGPHPRLEIGDSEVFFGEKDQIYHFLRRDQLRIEIIDGRYKFSTKVTDKNGNVIAEISRNEWIVQPPPTILDRNYNDEILEVRDARGDVILQVHALPDRIQVQGIWWTDASPWSGSQRIAIYTLQILELHGGKPLVVGSQLMIARLREGESADVIEPLFLYPSELHLGELKETRREQYQRL